MIITIQAVPERLESAREIANQFDNVTIHIDYNHKGSFGSFKDMLSYEVIDYRLHLQDDIIIADNLSKHLKELTDYMLNNNIDVLSLFAPRRQVMEKYMSMGTGVYPLSRFLMLQGCIFSKRFVDLMRDEVEITDETKHDDVFVQKVLNKHKIKAYVHLPSLVQHKVEKSIMGHPASVRRTSQFFEKGFYQ